MAYLSFTCAASAAVSMVPRYKEKKILLLFKNEYNINTFNGTISRAIFLFKWVERDILLFRLHRFHCKTGIICQASSKMESIIGLGYHKGSKSKKDTGQSNPSYLFVTTIWQLKSHWILWARTNVLGEVLLPVA